MGYTKLVVEISIYKKGGENVRDCDFTPEALTEQETEQGEYVPPKVANGLMIPGGKWFKARCDRFKQMGQRVQVAGAEISLF